MRHKEIGHIRSLETGAIPVIEQKEGQGDNMAFFDRLLKKRKEERSLMCEVCGRSFAHAKEWKCEKPYVCPDCRQLQELQTWAVRPAPTSSWASAVSTVATPCPSSSATRSA